MPAVEIVAELRLATREAHGRLEAGLALLAPPLSEVKFRHVLGRFRGFHAVWEPALAARADLHRIASGRSRLALLDSDLRRLGDNPALLPVCDQAAGLCATREAALGSLYVMEGSTLGGAVISRALADASWLPAGGLGYFSPYGPETGARWRELQAYLQQVSRDHGSAAIVQGALRTFDCLHAWVTARSHTG